MKRVALGVYALSMIVALRAALAIGGVDSAPAPSAPRPVSFAKPKESKLDNGLRVIVAERPALPLVAVQLVVRSGAETDPADRAGVASMTGSLLTRGTEKMSAPEIANAVESLGGMIFSGASWDASDAGVVVMSNKIEPALQILADAALRPSFKPEEIDRLKKQRLDALRVSLQQPGSLISYVATRVLFPTGEYAHPSGGTMETLQAIGRDDITKAYKAYYGPDNSVLMFVGNVTSEQGRAYAQQFFGTWKVDQSAPAKPSPQSFSDWKPQNIVVDMPQAGQAAVNIYKPAIKRDSPDFYTGLVANAALGRGFASRLNREIRIKRGLSYGASSFLDARRDVGTFGAGAQTKNESAAEVAALLKTELQRLPAEPVQGEELKSRQAMLIGNFARTMETNQGVAGEISGLAVYNLPLDTLDKFIPQINSVSSKDITGFAGRYLATPGALVIAGKAPAFLDVLKKNVPDVKVIPQSDLDLNRADLTRPK